MTFTISFPSITGSNPIALNSDNRNLHTIHLIQSLLVQIHNKQERTHAVLSSSCSAAGSDSSSACSSSLNLACSLSLLASVLSISLIAFASESRVFSSLFRVLVCASAEGTEEGRVEDTRAASRVFARA